jgi:phosphoribulokinase
VVIHIRNLKKVAVDFRYLLEVLDSSLLSRHDTYRGPRHKEGPCHRVYRDARQRMMEGRRRQAR